MSANGAKLADAFQTIEPAHPNARPVYWERGTGEIVGPGAAQFLARVGSGPKESYWVIALYGGLPVWINSTVLRSKKEFQSRRKPQVVEPIRELRR